MPMSPRASRDALAASHVVPWVRAAIVVASCTALAELLLAHVNLADLIMVYLAGVAYIALHEGARIAVVAVLVGIFLFDLLHVPPRWGLNPVNPLHLITLGVMAAVGVLISRLATWARNQTSLAESRARRSQALSDLAEALAVARSREAVADCLARAVEAACGAQVALHGQGHAAPPAPGAIRVPLRASSGATIGLLEARPSASQALTREDEDLLAAFGHQAALALERSQLEEREARAQVETETERLRSTLLAGISHDFRTPLTTIIGAATTLVEHDHQLDAPHRARLTQAILDESSRLHRVLSDLLDLTRLEEGAMPLQLEWCPADDLVAEALAVLGDRLSTHDIRADIVADTIVWCDARLVTQALVNMVDNALRYTPAGTRVTVRVRGAEGGALLEVADEGPGLPDGVEQDVFRKFQRGRHEPAGSGFGLGLAICAAVARVHGGHVRARNEGGACFTLTLPQPAAPVSTTETME